jgi:hypothetical protein
MPVQRVFRGRVVKRTRRRGSQVVVTFYHEVRGRPGPQLVVPVAEYLAHVQAFHTPPGSPTR